MSTRRLTAASNARSRERQPVRVPDLEGRRRRRAPAARRLATRSISSDASTPVTRRPAARQRERRPPGAGADVEHGPPVDRAEELREHLLLRLGEQRADRAAEPHRVEAVGHRRVGVDAVAVVVVGVTGACRLPSRSRGACGRQGFARVRVSR